MNVYRDHATPTESVEDYVARIEKAKRDDKPVTGSAPKEASLRPIGDNNGLAMAPMDVVMA